MYQRIKPLLGFQVAGQDGPIGRVQDLYLDDFQWRVRYFVVQLEKDLGSRLALLAPLAFHRVEPAAKKILSANLSRQQVQNSPDLDTDKPVARQHEVNLYDYYGWPYYWPAAAGPGTILGAGLTDFPPPPQPASEENPANQEAGDAHLRSLHEITGYKLQARDGSIGHLEDFISDDEDWKILYLIANTGSWLTGHDVLLSPQWVSAIKWADKRIELDLKRETIQNSPAYDAQTPLDAAYETRLKEHYQHHV